jgi:DNA (cytosine-5)-methyltransferase 1
MEPTFIEMFCGIGGFRLGLERSGWKCVWANDIDKYACQVYRKNFGDGGLVEGDIRSVDADSIPDHTLLTAGFPCQSFSLAGKRKGFEGTRGTLFYDIARVADAKRPPLLLLENVKGLLSNDKGRTFARILQTLDELGYDVEWQVLNSKYFGVPQNRERVFIIGHLRGTGSRQVFPIGQAVEGTNGARKKAQGEGALNVGGSGRERNLIASALIQSRGLETRNDGVSYSLKGAGG